VKEEYSSIAMAPMFTNGKRICMGMKKDLHLAENKETAVSELVPVSINKEIIPDSVFSLSGFQLENNNMPDTVKMTDSLQAELDSAIRKVKEEEGKKSKKSTHKKSSSKNTHTQPTKSAAIKPKQ
jgi:hypothetical protein